MSERGNPALHAVDRYLGISLLAVGGAFKRPRPMPPEIRRIGVVNSTNIGDTVVLSPVLEDLAAAYPDAEMLLFASDRMLAIAGLIEGVTPAAIQLSNPRAAIRALRAARLDVLLDFDSWPRVEPVYAMFSGARFAAGFKTPGEHRHFFYDATADHSVERHELENYRGLARVLGVESTSRPRLQPPGRLAPEQLPPAPYVVFHLWPTGMRSHLKEWPLEHWRRLARELAARGYTIVLTGAPADEPRTREFVEGSGDLRPRLQNVAGGYDLDEVLDVLHGSDCLVSVNTGVMHLGAAAGVPTVSLNGPTAEHRWGPVGERAVSVNSPLDGCGYLRFGWEYDGKREDCMLGVAPERVLETIVELIGDR